MATSLSDCASKVQRLHAAVVELERSCGVLQVDSLRGREWFELLTQKLLPQLKDDAFLVVAVVGGTNIGKSVIFNHIAGCRASSTSPLASGTKHPVCLVPPGFVERHDLSAVFPCFQLAEWVSAEAAIEDLPDDRLYWRVSPQTPDNLLVLDTPDIDSDAKVNWRRADNIRLCADVLIAVLTQQKYNDAAVKQFFRKAALEDKAVIVVFNQCELPEDDQYWPLWLDTFCRETGIAPEFVYVAPADRQAAEGNCLSFFERDIANSSSSEPRDEATNQPDESRNLAADLARLHFSEIKLRSLSGALQHLADPAHGLPTYLAEVRHRSGEFRAAAELLGAHHLADIDHWPLIPSKVMVTHLRSWWQSQREGWSARVHGFYNSLGSGLAWPIRFVRKAIQGEAVPPLERYRETEWNTILDTIDSVYSKLKWFSEAGNEQLRPRLQRLLGGDSRSTLLKDLHEAHATVDLEEELRLLVASEMSRFRDESPQHFSFFKRLDSLGAAARPATSIVLFLGGLGPLGDAAAQFVANSAMQSMIHVAGDVAGGTIVAAVGETAISGTASSGSGYLEAKFRNLHTAFAARRAGWLAEMLERHLLGALPEELRTAAAVPETASFQQAEESLRLLDGFIRNVLEKKRA